MFARHKIVWISGDGWKELGARAEDADRAVIEKWAAEDWPAIVRRQDEDAPEDQVCIGISLPPDPVDGRKRRIGLRVARSLVREVRPPLTVEEVLSASPEGWRQGLESMAQAAQRLRLTFRVYGSLALQALTGERYLTHRSDIDLLFHPRSVAQLGTGTGLLSYYANTLPLDGEIVFPESRGVAWKEWIQAMHASNNLRVLTKDAQTVSLKSTATLLEAFDQITRKQEA